MTAPAKVDLYVGVTPPANPSKFTRWISQSHQHMHIPMGWADRKPIIGTQGKTVTIAAQEISPWYNDVLARYECIVNLNNAQYFAYADTPLGPWSAPVKVLGSGSGGEAGTAQQCSHYIENGVLYVFYYSPGSSTNSIKMASAPMLTAVGTTPTFTVQGTALTSPLSGGTVASIWVMLVNGLYYAFVETNGAGTALYTSNAVNAAGLIATPFTIVHQQFTGLFRVQTGPRAQGSFGRPFVVYENGTWVMYCHSTSALQFGSAIYRWVCTDAGPYPINWVQDGQTPVVRRVTPYEIDQCADFRAVKGPNDRWYAFWTGLANASFNPVNVICAPMYEPIMAFDGATWAPTLDQSDPMNELGYDNSPDMLGGSAYVMGQNQAIWNDQANNTGGSVAFPQASTNSRAKVANGSIRGTAVLVITPAAGTTDTINDGNPIVSMTASGTTVTVQTARPHGLSTYDKVTVTGASPSAYNKWGGAVATVVDPNTFTYTADSAPGTNTTLGVFARGLMPGETVRYRCYLSGHWIRD